MGNARRRTIEKMRIPTHSQNVDELYIKLRNEGRLGRFIATVKLCSSKGYSLKETVDILKNTFRGYIENKEFNINTFIKMCQWHSDVAEAWGYGVYGDEVSNIMVKDRALELALNADDIEVIERYNGMYNRDVAPIKDEVDTGIGHNSTGQTEIRFNISPGSGD